MVMKTKLACGFQKCVGDQWLGESYHDFTVLVEDTSFQCHRFILSACSEYFKTLLRTHMKENPNKSVFLGGMAAQTFQTIIDAIYKGEVDLTANNIIDIWLASEQLGIKYLITECEDFVLTNLTTQNYITYFQHAKLLCSVRVIREVEKFMSQNFEKVCKTITFLELSVEELHSRIRSQDVRVKSDEMVLESIIKWVKHNPQPGNKKLNSNMLDSKDMDSTTELRRLKHLPALIERVHLHLVSVEVLENLVNEDFLLRNREAFDIVLESLFYRLQTERRHGPWPEAAIHRNSSDKQLVMVFSFGSQVTAYSLNDNTFHDILCLSEMNGFCKHIFSFNNALHICQTYTDYGNNQKINRKCLPPNPRWGNLSKVIHDSIKCIDTSNLLSYGNCMYHFCRCGDSPHRYRHEKGNRGGLGALNRIVSAVTYGKYIVCFIMDSSSQARVKCYDSESTKSWDISRLVGPMYHIVAFSDSKDTYLLQRNGFLTKILNTEPSSENFRFISQLWSGDWDLCGAVLFRAELFVFGKTQPEFKVILQTLPGVFGRVKLVPVESSTQCWPMVLPKSCLQ